MLVATRRLSLTLDRAGMRLVIVSGIGQSICLVGSSLSTQQRVLLSMTLDGLSLAECISFHVEEIIAGENKIGLSRDDPLRSTPLHPSSSPAVQGPGTSTRNRGPLLPFGRIRNALNPAGFSRDPQLHAEKDNCDVHWQSVNPVLLEYDAL